MSVAELLSAIRALPKAEQVQLMRLLNEAATETAPTDDGIPEELRKMLPPPGSVIEIWSPDVVTDAAGWAAIEQALAELFPTGATFDVHTPPDGYEAAATLQQLLASRQEQK